MDTAEWQKRLEDHFTIDGAVGGNLTDIVTQENACGEYFLNKFIGHNVLMSSFQSFFMETIGSSFNWVQEKGWPEKRENYAPILCYYNVSFKSFRACENLLIKGYPLDGYALLRDLKDRCIFLAAIAHNLTTFSALLGVKGFEELTFEDKRKKIHRLRKDEEYRLLNLMIRKDSGLPDDTKNALELWEQLFNEEVHGSKFSFFNELGTWFRDKVQPPIAPVPRDDQLAMYMNRSCEIGWLFVRLLPYLQLESNAFGDAWREKQQVLDDSFRHMQRGLGKLGKDIGEAFIKFVDEKFSFNDPFFYFEADGKG